MRNKIYIKTDAFKNEEFEISLYPKEGFDNHVVINFNKLYAPVNFKVYIRSDSNDLKSDPYKLADIAKLYFLSTGLREKINGFIVNGEEIESEFERFKFRAIDDGSEEFEIQISSFYSEELRVIKTN